MNPKFPERLCPGGRTTLAWILPALLALLCLGGQYQACAQSCASGGAGGVTCNVQYQVSSASLDKWGYQEYTNEDLPRVNIYHHQTRIANTQYRLNQSGNQGYSVNTPNVSLNVTDGPWSETQNQNLATVLQEYKEGLFATYSNYCSGTFSKIFDQADAREWGYDDLGSGPVRTNYVDNETEQLSAQQCTNNCCDSVPGYVPGWSFQGTDIDNGYEAGVGYADGWGSTNYPDGCIPDGYQFIVINPVLATNSYSYTNYDAGYANGNESENDSETETLDTLYSDGEFYANIMSIMPDYTGGWNGSGDFWNVVAYSVIGADHIDGGPWSEFPWGMA